MWFIKGYNQVVRPKKNSWVKKKGTAVPQIVNLKSNTMKNTVQMYGIYLQIANKMTNIITKCSFS